MRTTNYFTKKFAPQALPALRSTADNLRKCRRDKYRITYIRNQEHSRPI
jgi:hypothetical protein